MERFKGIEKTLLPGIGKTAKLLTYFFNETFIKNDIHLSKEQFLVLKKLYESDGQTQNDLAYITDRSKTSLTRLINTIEKKELVYRIISKEDKRISHIYLTPLGRATLVESIPIVANILDELLLDIPQKDIDKALEVLNQIQLNMSKKININ